MLDDTPVTVTLPAHMWTALRGAARRAARSDRRAADRRASAGAPTAAPPTAALPPHRRPPSDLDAHRAVVLADAAARIDAALGQRAAAE